MAVLAAAAVPATAGAHVSLQHFSLAPACVTPGASVNYSVGIRQSHWYHVHELWSRVTVTHGLTGVVVLRKDRGPRYVPYGSYGESGTETVPSSAPPGDYLVRLDLGYERGYSNWGSATRWLRVRPTGALCIV